MSENSNNPLSVSFHVDTGRLFWLAIKTTLLTVITLGVYRFWARTRIRRYIWSAIRPGGDEFEYTGTGLEKFLGFLLAVVILAVYLGILQVLLTFVGFNLLGTMTDQVETEAEALRQVAATYITLIALAPLLFFAQYRARRYLMSRTRWRGVRLAMDKAAWGYVWRGLLYSLITILSLGLLLPLATFKLEQYMTDRTWYGDAKLVQGGRWTMLYRPMLHFFLAIFLFIAAGTLIGVGAETGQDALAALGGILLFLTVFYYLFAGFYYQVESFKRLTNSKVLDEVVTFESQAQTWSVIGLTLLGLLIVWGIAFAALIVIALVLGIGAAIFGAALGSFDNPALFVGPMVLVGGIGYLLLLAVISATALTFISAPVLGHFVSTLKIKGADHLDTVKQRMGDDIADADGFADALDIGGAF